MKLFKVTYNTGVPFDYGTEYILAETQSDALDHLHLSIPEFVELYSCFEIKIDGPMRFSNCLDTVEVVL